MGGANVPLDPSEPISDNFRVDDPDYTPAMLDRYRKTQRDRLDGFRADEYYVNALEAARYEVTE